MTPELNPYEAPQSVDVEFPHPGPPREDEYPRWINKAFQIQLVLIVGVVVVALFITGPLSQLYAIWYMIFYSSLAIMILIGAIRYRIGRLVAVELFLIALLLLGFLG